MRKQTIKKGDKYNRLTAVRFDHMDKHWNAYWLFKCQCGNKKVINVSSVKTGHIKSCGCLQKEMMKNRMIIHGMSYTKEYSIWGNMKDRCYNKKSKEYKNYGDRGIKVCNRWMKFENFYKDMGKKPVKKSLDRINNNNNYKPNNCRWATRKEQNNNKRNNYLLTFNNKTMTIAEWSDKLDINYSTLRGRLKLGWSAKKTLTTPINNNKKNEK